jgi:hypothetical protein
MRSCSDNTTQMDFGKYGLQETKLGEQKVADRGRGCAKGAAVRSSDKFI